MSKDLTFKQGKKNREELQLPIMHFVVVDDWMDKLGMEAFRAWLKFYSWCDRSEERKNKDNDMIPCSFGKVMKRLGVGNTKFYNSIIRPLWNYGFIDIVEYEDSKMKGNKPKNIIVYEYPQNDRNKKYEPLEKIRDYDTEYETASRTFAKQGGRKKNENIPSDGFAQKPGVVSHRNQGWFRDETGGGFTQKPNNVSNSIINDSNTITNVSNHSINSESENEKDTRQEKNEGQDGQTDNNLAYQLNYENQNILPESLHQYVIDHEEELKTINVTMKHVQSFYLKYKDTIDDDVMVDALKKIIDRQERIGRFNIYFYKACQYVIEDRNKAQRTEHTGKTKHVKTDNLPEWLRAEQGDEIAQKQIDKKNGQWQNDDMEAKKREFEELMKMRESVRKQQRGDF